MTKPFADKVALIWDQGLYTHIAEKLADDFGQVLYFADWRSAFPYSGRAHIGLGLKDITVVRNPWDHVDDADLIVFPDVYFSSEQEFLRKRLGKRVWGSGNADALELYRNDLKEILTSVGLPVSPYETVIGLTALREYLLKNEGVYVKASLFRGDCETFKAPNYLAVRTKLDEMAAHLGPRQDTIAFTVEKKIEGAELGFDGSCILGQFSNFVAWGYEAKDSWYLGQICAYKDLPQPLKITNEKLAPVLRELDIRGFWSTEVREIKILGPVLMDPCARAGSPPSEVYMEGFLNWSEHMMAGADGELIDLEPAGRYMAEIIMRSPRVEKEFLALQFPEEYRQNIKIHGHCILDGIDYACPLGIQEFASAVAVGATLEEAIDLAKEVASSIEGESISYEANATDALGKIEEGKKVGIEW